MKVWGGPGSHGNPHGGILPPSSQLLVVTDNPWLVDASLQSVFVVEGQPPVCLRLHTRYL